MTKKVEPEVAAALVELGSLDLGENRLSELERKRAWFDARGLRARWHFIGHIQRNKARRTLLLSDEIHSVDSARLLSSLLAAAAEEDVHPGIYLQVKLRDEATKSGFAPDDVASALEQARESGALPVLGLMTMAPLVADPDESLRAARAAFAELARLATDLAPAAFENGAPALSMGMTGDFEEAIREGAHVVRIGSALYKGPQGGCDRGSVETGNTRA